MNKTSIKILLLCGISDTSNIVYNYLKDKFDIAGVVVETPNTLRERIKSKRKFIKWRIKHLGFSTAIGQLLFSTFIDYPLRRLSRRRKNEILINNGLSTTAFDESIVYQVEKHNSDETISLIAKLEPDIIVVNGTSILRPKLLDSTKIPFINTHLGITPMYRGVHGMYWALVNDDKEHAGVTVHFIDKGVDTGKIILQAKAVAAKNDNFATYPYLQIAEGVKILAEAIKAVSNGIVTKPAVTGESKQYYHPTLWQYIRHRIARGIK